MRATRHAALAARVASSTGAVAEAEARLEVARRRGAERLAAVETVERIEPSAAGAPEAEALRRRWQALSEAVQTQAAAVEALAGLRFDAEEDASRTVALAQVRAELEALVVVDGVPALEARVAALEAVAAAGPLDAASAQERAAAEAADAAERAVAGAGVRLAGEREHLAALSGEDGAACPVCLRPFEGPREALMAEHERRITRLEAELASAEHDRWTARAALEAARDAHERAARAASALESATRAVAAVERSVGEDLRAAEAATGARARGPASRDGLAAVAECALTDGAPRCGTAGRDGAAPTNGDALGAGSVLTPAALEAARDELGRVVRAREHALARRSELRRALTELESAARAAGEARARHGRLAAAVGAREEDVAAHLRELGVAAYDRHAHLAATEEAGRLVALQEELVRARAVVAAFDAGEEDGGARAAARRAARSSRPCARSWRRSRSTRPRRIGSPRPNGPPRRAGTSCVRWPRSCASGPRPPAPRSRRCASS